MCSQSVQKNNKDNNKNVAELDSRKSLRAWLHLIKCAKSIEQEMSDRFRENFNSSLSRFDVMAHLHLAGDEGMGTSLLASRLLASKGNITRLLDRMEQDDLIIRKSTPNDRRVSNIYLSKKGKELFAQMAPKHQSWSHEILDVLSARQKQQLTDILKKINEKLKE